MTKPFRERVVQRLLEDLVGPMSPAEIIADRPTQRYSTGILYPQGALIQQQENQDGGLPVNVPEDSSSQSDDTAVSLHSALKPAAAGLSFAVSAESGKSPLVHVGVRCAIYERFAVNDAEEKVSGEPADRKHERWQRRPLSCELSKALEQGEVRVDLTPYGIPGLELYILVTPHSGLLTATFALCNQRRRGESSVFDEEQHFFQTELRVADITNGAFAPRPSRRAETDDDSRAAALIYRGVEEYVVGHTCSARATIVDDAVRGIQTEWVPAVIVPGVSDHGDVLFETLTNSQDGRVLRSAWLASSSPDLLPEALERLVATYSTWIEREQEKIRTLAAPFQAQAKLHIERCEKGVNRMREGIDAIRRDPQIGSAFQLAQRAMSMQFSWTRKGAELVWRPFQLAFQLLVLASIAERTHKDRAVMDLLWFPTGGGKTEAYLALTAFVILLRRLRGSDRNDGTGIAVLMRYTLRLLTIQQFQRAAAMIAACELLRRRGEVGSPDAPTLGKKPIGIGLWVGAAATPLTLEDAVKRSAGDPSTPEQLTTCPCCGERLQWRVTSKESVVECRTSTDKCEFAASGRRLPVWTIDEEVYRFAPALLIGTVDKFAQIVRKLETKVLFGRGSNVSPPDLIVQDELHLISGPLGSMAGLYEVAIDELCRRDDVRAKVIGSTATIRRAQEQIAALFDRDAYQFPAPGIDASNSGFAVTDVKRPGRLHVGLTTAGRSATYMIQALVASLLQAASESSASKEERDYYWTLVTYFNSLRELGRALVLMQDDVPISIGQFAARRGENARRIDTPAELTSRVRSYEIRDMLERLNIPVDQPGAVDLLAASNMISVGVDIPRLGLMVVNTQPKTLSEYIQATSRVGRGRVPGLVITMYNSMRARDRSHYETFETWHRCLYRDVEATSVTPFASRAQDKALHAVLVALVRHIVPGMDRDPILDDVRRVQAERVAALIESRAARIDPAERIAVSQKLKRLIDQWADRDDLQTYWDDYERRTSLLMSAEQFAAKADVDQDLDPEGSRRALWPTPNSMREVEAGTPYVLRHVLKSEGN